MRTDPLRVTGYSMLSALGGSRQEHLTALRAGRTGLGPSPLPLPFQTAVGAVPTALQELPGELAPWSTRLARMTAHLVRALDEPLRRARERWRPERIAVLLGTSTAGAESTERAYRVFIAEGVFPDRYDFLRQHTFGAVLHVVAELTGARGPAWMVSTACTSGAKPFASAQRLMAAGLIDAAIVGGVDTLCAMTLHGFESLPQGVRVDEAAFCQRTAELHVLRAVRDRLRDPQVVDLQAQSRDPVRARTRERHETVPPALGEHGRRFGHALRDQRLVAGVVVADQRAAPVAQKRLGMTARAAVGEVVDHRLDRIERPDAVGPQVGAVRLARTRIEHRHRGLVRV